MDLHKADDYESKPTIEEIKRNHIADLETQAKYGVRFIQYWINEEAGLVFCLMEAPDKESCIATHQEAHGNMACNVIELKGGDYKIFMGDVKANEFDIAEDMHGVLDSGSRSFLVVDIISPLNDNYPFTKLKEVVQRFGGREVGFKNGRCKFVFNTASNAVACARTFQRELTTQVDDKKEIRIALSCGDPVTEQGSIFAETIQLADWLCDITKSGHISVSSKTLISNSDLLLDIGDATDVKMLNQIEERFLKILMGALTPNLTTDQLSVERLSKEVGISQAQLYRRVTALTGYSPNAFVQEIKLRNSLRLLDQEFGNIAQIAFECGFNSSSYFTKSFKKRFGISPKRAKAG